MSSTRQIICATVLVWSVWSATFSACAETGPTYTVFLASTNNDGVLQQRPVDSHFDCSDTVYLVVQGSVQPDRKLTAYWIGPTGKEHVRASRSFVKSDAGWWSWSGLQLRRAAGTNVLSALDPGAGFDGFRGPWQVAVHVGEQRITRLGFELVC